MNYQERKTQLLFATHILLELPMNQVNQFLMVKKGNISKL